MLLFIFVFTCLDFDFLPSLYFSMLYLYVDHMLFSGLLSVPSSSTFYVLFFITVYCFFFFQAEDGIRDDLVTGVQTCALPIWTGMDIPLVDLLWRQPHCRVAMYGRDNR